VNDGEDALEPRELPGPQALNGGAVDRSDLDEGPFPLPSFLSRAIEPDHSLSVAGELTESSKSSTLLNAVPPLVDADPDTRLRDEELAFISFSFSFSSKPMNIRDRASL
jgi:hypothetical protein